MELLPLCMMNRSIFLEEFLEFLPTCGTTRITADQWNSFLEFSHAVSADLSGYEEVRRSVTKRGESKRSGSDRAEPNRTESNRNEASP